MKQAIDVSYCQQNVDYKKVKAAGISAVIVRNGYLGKTDNEYDKHVQGALAAGLDVGTYTYIMSETVEQAHKEAAETIKRLERYKGKINYPVFADMESNKYLTSQFNKASRTKILIAFLRDIQQAGYYAAVYINPSWLETYVDKHYIVGIYDIWLAAWTNSINKPTKYQYGQTMWQWGTAKISGIQGEVDADAVYVDYPQRIKQAKKNFLPTEKLKTVTLAFQAAVRSAPTSKAQRLGVLNPDTKCTIVIGSDTKDKATGYIYVKLGGEQEQWIVKTAIKM